jgi:hypothetical protein
MRELDDDEKARITLMERRDLAERWLQAERVSTDNPRLVADDVATHINSEWATDLSLDRTHDLLKALDDDTVRSLMMGPPPEVTQA